MATFQKVFCSEDPAKIQDEGPEKKIRKESAEEKITYIVIYVSYAMKIQIILIIKSHHLKVEETD